MEKLNIILGQIKQNLDNPSWLTEALIDLSVILIHTSENISQAQFEEESVALSCIDSAGEKKVSVAESEKRAIVQTNNRYKQLILEREGIIETINTLKKRIEILSWERRNS